MPSTSDVEGRVSEAPVTDDELIPGNDRVAEPRVFLRRGLAAGLALLGLAACALALAQKSGPWAAERGALDDLPESVSARQLLESRALADTLAESFSMVAVRNGHMPSPDDRAALKAHVRSGLKQASDTIHEAYPEETARMNKLQLSRPEQGAILRAMSYAADPRVVEAGRGMLSSAVDAARDSGVAKSTRQQHLADQLRPHAQAVRELREEISHTVAQEPRLERLRLFKSVDKWAMQAGDHAAKGQLASARQLFGLDEMHAGMMQQAQSFMDFMRIFHGVQMPDVSGLDEAGLGEMLQCVSDNLSAMSLTNVASCMSSYFGSIVDMVKSTFGFDDESETSTEASTGTDSPWR